MRRVALSYPAFVRVLQTGGHVRNQRQRVLYRQPAFIRVGVRPHFGGQRAQKSHDILQIVDGCRPFLDDGPDDILAAQSGTGIQGVFDMRFH